MTELEGILEAPAEVKVELIEAGPRGEKGDTGERGPQGEKGEKGDRGPQGEKGEKGDRGLQGEKGEKGDTGLQGEKGEKGDQGQQGEKGEKGDTGQQGEKGEKGERGLQGEKGDTGERGPQGEKGDTGERGPQGEKGEKGDTGPQGEKGEPGTPATVNGKSGESITLTAADIGLGNVPNVATNDQTPTYSAASSLAGLTSGEKLSVALGKTAKAVSELISHLANKGNPHGVTASQVGAAASGHTHDDRYFTETEVTAKLAGKSDTSHSHTNYVDKTSNQTIGGTKTFSSAISLNGTTLARAVESNDSMVNLRRDGLMVWDMGTKPQGIYTGTGSAAELAVSIGGRGSVVLVYYAGYIIFVTSSGGMLLMLNSTTVTTIGTDEVKFTGGVMRITSTRGELNKSGRGIGWVLL